MAAIFCPPYATTTSYQSSTYSLPLYTQATTVERVNNDPPPVEKEEQVVIQPRPKIMKVDFKRPKQQTFMQVQRKSFTSFLNIRPQRI